MRRQKIFIGIVLVLFSIVFSIDIKFSAKDASSDTQKMGVVYYQNRVVMRLISNGDYISPFARAQIIAYRLNEYVKTPQDLKRMIFTYPNDIYTASIDGKRIFSVYLEEIKYNDSTPEGLMSSWVNNLKRVMLDQVQQTEEEPNMDQQAETPSTSESEMMQTEPVVENKPSDEKPQIKADSETKPEIKTGTKIIEIEELRARVLQVEKRMKDIKRPKGSRLSWLFIIINFILVAGVGIMSIFMKRQIGDFVKIEKTDQLEELENSVSALMKELQETSDQVSQKAKAALQEVESKLEGKAPPSATEESVNENTEPVQESPEPPKETPPKPEPEVPEVEEPENSSQADEGVTETAEEPTVEETAAESPAVVQEPEPTQTTEPESSKPDAEKLAEELEQQTQEESKENSDTSAEPSEESEDEGPITIDDPDMDEDLKAELENVLNNADLSQNQKVVQLASINTMEDDIAKYLNMGVGEVELILQLNN